MEELIRNFGYIVIFFYSLGGGFIALGVGAVLAYAGELNFVVTLVLAGVANFIGDILLFYVAKYNHAYAKEMFAKHRRKLAYSHLIMKKYGWLAIFIQKYIYGVKTLIPIAIGLTKYNQYNFIIFNLLATIVWTLVIGYGAYALGETFIDAIEGAKYYMVGFVVTVMGVVLYIFRGEFSGKEQKA